MSNNYQNHIYLFNDNQTVKVISNDQLMSYDIGTATEAFVGALVGDENTSYKLIDPKTKDFPTADTSTERQGEIFKGSSKHHKYTAKTNDPGMDPARYHSFEVILDEEKNKGAKFYKWQGYKTIGSLWEMPYEYSFDVPGKDKPNKMKIAKPYYMYQEYDWNPQLKPIDEKEPFIYYQNVLYRAGKGANVSADKVEITKKQVNSFFNNFISLGDQIMEWGNQIVKVPISIKDVSTKIGIPYDFQTMMINDLDAKTIGVKSGQPRYDKIYNYYDPQYESVVMQVVEEGLTDERALPSIYDFLYFPSQESLSTVFKLPSLSMEETNLAGINQYLDKYAQLYEKYLTEGSPKETINDYIGNNFSLNGQDLLDFNVTLEELGESTSPINFDPTQNTLGKPTGKQTLLQTIEQISKHEGMLDEDKKNKTPIWINELKTGIYFSQKSMDIFNQTMDKDYIFPFLMKINIPTETIGPIARILSQQGILDVINIYAASLVIPTDDDKSTYSNFYGAVLNGIDSTNFNTLYDFKMPSFKLFFKKKPDPSVNFKDLAGLSTLLGAPETVEKQVMGSDTSLGLPSDAFTEPTTTDEPTVTAIYNSWRQKMIDKFIYSMKVLHGKSIFVKSDGSPRDIFIKEKYPPRPYWDKTTEPLLGIILEIGAYCFEEIDPGQGTSTSPIACVNELLNGKIDINKWTLEKFMAEKEWIISTNDNIPYTGNPEYSAAIKVYEFPKDLDFDSIYSTKKYSSDLYLNDLPNGFLTDVLAYTGKNEEETFTSNNAIQALIKKLKMIDVKKKLQKLFTEKDLFRTPVDIHEGKLAHQETLMYEIAKYTVSDTGEEKYLQSIFLPIVEQSNLSYYDTQIVPYRKYFYKIFVHKAILGTEYKLRSTPLNFNYDSAKQSLFFNLQYQVEPYLEIVRVPYYNTEAVNIKVDKLNYSTVEDDPPLPPQVKIVPFRNVNDKLLILLNNSIGQIEAFPVILFDEDKEKFEDAALSQDKLPLQQIRFKSDDSMGTFTMFRVENTPSSYKEAIMDPTLETDTLNNMYVSKLREDSLIDNILTNKDYYYFFRFEDLHGKISNPTEVYKVRIIHEVSTLPYLTMETIDMREVQKKKHDEKFSAIRKMKKYLYIQPNELQSLYSTPTNDGLGISGIKENYLKLPVALGNPQNSVFGKKFKLRISSKQTGKKIDINLTVKNPENIIND